MKLLSVPLDRLHGPSAHLWVLVGHHCQQYRLWMSPVKVALHYWLCEFLQVLRLNELLQVLRLYKLLQVPTSRC